MRPVIRGTHPNDDEGHRSEFRIHKDAKAALLTRLGKFCSYCERTRDLHVEHVIPLNSAPGLRLEWKNFLLGCGNCNPTKGARNTGREGYIWPDRDNTFRSFVYSVGGVVSVNVGLSTEEYAKADALFKLVGLGKRPSFDPQAKDLRWNERRSIWRKAQHYRKRYVEGSVDLEVICDMAEAKGFWSIWMTVFSDLSHVTQSLVHHFPGTNKTYFSSPP